MKVEELIGMLEGLDNDSTVILSEIIQEDKVGGLHHNRTTYLSIRWSKPTPERETGIYTQHPSGPVDRPQRI